MRRFKSAVQVQRFPPVYGMAGNLSRLIRRLPRANHFREFAQAHSMNGGGDVSPNHNLIVKA